MDPDFCDRAGGGIAYSSSWIFLFGKGVKKFHGVIVLPMPPWSPPIIDTFMTG